ncbi:hypothetical protein APX70_01485, partial [Pseudomonas syringae pv. maculicola]
FSKTESFLEGSVSYSLGARIDTIYFKVMQIFQLPYKPSFGSRKMSLICYMVLPIQSLIPVAIRYDTKQFIHCRYTVQAMPRGRLRSRRQCRYVSI